MLTWTECEVSVDCVPFVSAGSMRCASNDLRDVTLITYFVTVSVFATG